MEAKRRIRLIAFDLDGTVLRGHAELSERNRLALEKAEQAGVLTVPNTGRVKSFIPPCLTLLPCIRYAVTSNGAAVWDLHTGEALCADLIPTETTMLLHGLFLRYGLFVEYYVNGNVIVGKDEPERAKTVYGLPASKHYFLTKDYTCVENIAEYFRTSGAQPEKINLMYIPEEVREELLDALKKVKGLTLTYSNVDNMEINAEGCGKGSGLLKLCAVLGIDPAETMAVGDNGNDLDMLRAAGFAAVVGNGIDEAKAVADVVTAPCAEDGFAEAVERFVL